jgi:hypothetical protein
VTLVLVGVKAKERLADAGVKRDNRPAKRCR